MFFAAASARRADARSATPPPSPCASAPPPRHPLPMPPSSPHHLHLYLRLITASAVRYRVVDGTEYKVGETKTQRDCVNNILLDMRVDACTE
ncbi:hypothetical protein Scep_002557 [Stephania cephalantha]|uniref:Uncharacterized protein n=1 Tax=Stephania cephalantha TaxID=152367 RepID=A0AAP0Q8W6_9MAGN